MMVWLLMWLSVGVATLNVTLQFLVINIDEIIKLGNSKLI